MEEELNLTEIHKGGGYDSSFEYDSDTEKKRKAKDDLVKSGPIKMKSKASKEVFAEECSREEGRRQRYHLLSLDAYSRHKKLVNEYLLSYPGSTSKLKRNTSRDKTDIDVIRENHKFLWDESGDPDTWEKRLAKKYYDKLFKEYCLTDLSHYKENKIALRWRTEQEVVDGKGQFACGEKKCHATEGLRSWEVNFGYVEQGHKKNALVKLRLCPDCSYKLNYHYQRKEVRRCKKNKQETVEVASHKRQKTSEEDHYAKGSQSKEDDIREKTSEKLTNTGESVENNEIWKGPPKLQEEQRSLDDDFEEYLADMLL